MAESHYKQNQETGFIDGKNIQTKESTKEGAAICKVGNMLDQQRVSKWSNRSQDSQNDDSAISKYQSSTSRQGPIKDASRNICKTTQSQAQQPSPSLNQFVKHNSIQASQHLKQDKVNKIQDLDQDLEVVNQFLKSVNCRKNLQKPLYNQSSYQQGNLLQGQQQRGLDILSWNRYTSSERGLQRLQSSQDKSQSVTIPFSKNSNIENNLSLHQKDLLKRTQSWGNQIKSNGLSLEKTAAKKQLQQKNGNDSVKQAAQLNLHFAKSHRNSLRIRRQLRMNIRHNEQFQAKDNSQQKVQSYSKDNNVGQTLLRLESECHNEIKSNEIIQKPSRRSPKVTMTQGQHKTFIADSVFSTPHKNLKRLPEQSSQGNLLSSSSSMKRHKITLKHNHSQNLDNAREQGLQQLWNIRDELPQSKIDLLQKLQWKSKQVHQISEDNSSRSYQQNPLSKTQTALIQNKARQSESHSALAQQQAQSWPAQHFKQSKFSDVQQQSQLTANCGAENFDNQQNGGEALEANYHKILQLQKECQSQYQEVQHSGHNLLQQYKHQIQLPQQQNQLQHQQYLVQYQYLQEVQQQSVHQFNHLQQQRQLNNQQIQSPYAQVNIKQKPTIRLGHNQNQQQTYSAQPNLRQPIKQQTPNIVVVGRQSNPNFSTRQSAIYQNQQKVQEEFKSQIQTTHSTQTPKFPTNISKPIIVWSKQGYDTQHQLNSRQPQKQLVQVKKVITNVDKQHHPNTQTQKVHIMRQQHYYKIDDKNIQQHNQRSPEKAQSVIRDKNSFHDQHSDESKVKKQPDVQKQVIKQYEHSQNRLNTSQFNTNSRNQSQSSQSYVNVQKTQQLFDKSVMQQTIQEQQNKQLFQVEHQQDQNNHVSTSLEDLNQVSKDQIDEQEVIQGQVITRQQQRNQCQAHAEYLIQDYHIDQPGDGLSQSIDLDSDINVQQENKIIQTLKWQNKQKAPDSKSMSLLKESFIFRNSIQDGTPINQSNQQSLVLNTCPSDTLVQVPVRKCIRVENQGIQKVKIIKSTTIIYGKSQYKKLKWVKINQVNMDALDKRGEILVQMNLHKRKTRKKAYNNDVQIQNTQVRDTSEQFPTQINVGIQKV